MVVAGHPQAAEAGRRILEQGGSAMDAAVAVSFSLGVAEPYGSGLGGKLMMLYYDAAEQRTLAIDAMDQASASLDPETFSQRPRGERTEGWGAVAVPGLVAGMFEGHRRWGRLPWSTVVGPAVRLAREGGSILPQTREFFQRRVDRLRVSSEAQQIFLPGGELPLEGQTLANPDLSKTLEAIAQQGSSGFYRGWVAESIVHASQDGGGSLTLDDLRTYEARVVEPFAIDFEGFQVVSAPPPASGGATLLAALVKLRGSQWTGETALDASSLQLSGEALLSVYSQIQARIGDVPTARRGFEELIALRSESVPKSPLAHSADPEPPAAGGPEEQSTTHFVVVDSKGNIATVTQSLSHHFGAGVVAPGTGVLLNNTMKNFTISDESSVNAPAPSKRPRSTIAPTLVFRNAEPVLALGIPGGQRIPTATLQVLLDVIVFGTDLPTAVARPRAHLKRPLRPGEPTNLYELEGADEVLAAALQEQGWQVLVNEDREAFGGFCAVELRADGALVGVADLRRTNAARSLRSIDN